MVRRYCIDDTVSGSETLPDNNASSLPGAESAIIITIPYFCAEVMSQPQQLQELQQMQQISLIILKARTGYSNSFSEINNGNSSIHANGINKFPSQLTLAMHLQRIVKYF